MKYVLIGSFCLSFLLVGCQSYPKNPTPPKAWGKKEPVNLFVPNELKPYEIPEDVAYVSADKVVPKKIIVIQEGLENAQ